MIKIAHVSDLHFHHAVINNKKAVSLLKKVQTAYPFNTGYNYLLITGDITDDGDKLQFAKAFAALKPFVGHLLLTPGNHDYGPLGNFYTEESAKAFDEYLLQKLAINHHYIDKQPMTDVLDDTQGTQVLAVGLNSVVNTEIPFDFARGEIGDDQLTSLQSILSDPKYANMHKLVYLHHRPQKCNDWFLELVDAEDLMAILNQSGVDVIAFGHTGGNMIESEPPQARTVRVFVRKFGVKYLLNANTSVDAQKFNEIIFDGGNISVKTV
jgi:predicted phosphodiesterase